MSQEERDRIEDLFARALEQPPEQWESWLGTVEDLEVRREVRSLLSAHQQNGRFDGITDQLRGAHPAAGAVFYANLLDRLRTALIGRYTIERTLSRGTTALVYLAQDLKHDRPVALKVLRPEFGAILGSEGFLREVRITARLHHPHILPLLDSGDADGFVYYVMPLAEGESLRDRLEREKRLPLEEALRIAREVADALSYAHQHDVVHRDIKPENILLESGHAMVADFGIARAISAAGGERLTQTGLATGTPVYMSPEQATGNRELDGRSDLYSLGCVLYEMLLGQPPFDGSDAQSLLEKKWHEAPPVLRPLRPNIPAHVERVVLTLLARRPEDRFPTGKRLVVALDRVTPVPSLAGRGTARRGRAVWLTSSAVVAVVLAAGLWVVWRLRPSSGPIPSPHRLVILPFSVLGSEDLRYLHEGMVDLLSTALDGAGDLQTVDPHALLSFIRQRGVAPDPDAGALVARHFGAGLYLLGTVVDAGDQVQVYATLYDHQRSIVQRAEATLDDRRKVMALVDDLGRQLLATGVGGPGTHLSAIAARTTQSLPALRDYLKGENALRFGLFDSALAAYQRAVTEDTTFALAYYRLAIAASYPNSSDIGLGGAVQRALRYQDRLPEYDLELVKAQDDYLHGAVADAQRRLRTIVGAHPNDVEAWHSLGRLLLWYAPVATHPLSEARTAFERVLELDPNHLQAIYHLSWIAGIEGDRDRALQMLERWLQLSPESNSAPARRAAVAYARGNRALQEQSLAELRRAADMVVYFAAADVASAAGDLHGAIEVARLLTAPYRSQYFRALGHSLVAHLDVGLGHWRAARAELRLSKGLNTAPQWSSLVARASLATSPFLPVSRQDLLGLRSQVLRSAPHATSPLLDRLYLAGILSLRLGDRIAADRYANELESSAVPPASGTSTEWTVKARDLALAVRAHAAMANGQVERAWSLLDQRKSTPWFLREWNPLALQPSERMLAAEVQQDLGHDQEALMWLESFGWSPFEQAYVAPAHLQRAEIYERLGKRDAAVHHYERVIALWRDCDPELRVLVDRAKAGLTRLGVAIR